MPGVILDGRVDPGFTVDFSPDTGLAGVFGTEQFKDLPFRDRLEFTVQYVSPTYEQQKTNTLPACDNGCPTPVPVLLRLTPDAQFRVAEALTDFDDEKDVLIFGDPEHMRAFYFRLDNMTNITGMNVRTRWFFEEEGKAPVEFTPEPANPIFERPEFQNTHWDGTVNGRGEAQAGTYFWYAKYKSIAGVETVRTGSVSLIR